MSTKKNFNLEISEDEPLIKRLERLIKFQQQIKDEIRQTRKLMKEQSEISKNQLNIIDESDKEY